MRTTTSRLALVVASSLALAGATLAADSRGGERRASTSSGGSTAVSRASSGTSRASAPAPRASAPAVRSTAPVRVPTSSGPARYASDQSPRTAPAGSEPVGTAVSRGGDSGGGGSVSGGSSSGGGSSYPGGTETIQSTSGGHDRRASGSSGRGNAVSRGDRSRGDRSVIGTAQGRTHPPYGGGGGGGGAWDPGYWWNDPGYAWGYGGLGLGYFYFDPFWGGYGGGDPFGYGVGGGGYSGGYDSFVQHGFLGQLRLKMKPKDAQVYVDGALAGKVGDFDGTFERLDLPEGPHRVEVRLEGHTPLTFDVNIVVDELTTLRGKIQD